MTIVTLTPGEMILGAFVGLHRSAAKLANGRQDRHGAEALDGPALDVLGARGEIAVAKALGLFWTGALDFRAPDVGGYIEVKTRSRHSYELPVYPESPDDEPFVLVTSEGGSPDFHIIGWLRAGDGKRPEYQKTPREGGTAYFVPHSKLEKLSDLPSLRERAAA